MKEGMQLFIHVLLILSSCLLDGMEKHKSELNLSRQWWCTPLIPGHRRQSQVIFLSSKSGWSTELFAGGLHRETLFRKANNKKKGLNLVSTLNCASFPYHVPEILLTPSSNADRCAWLWYCLFFGLWNPNSRLHTCTANTLTHRTISPATYI